MATRLLREIARKSSFTFRRILAISCVAKKVKDTPHVIAIVKSYCKEQCAEGQIKGYMKSTSLKSDHYHASQSDL